MAAVVHSLAGPPPPASAGAEANLPALFTPSLPADNLNHPFTLLVPTRRSVLADEVGRSLYEELDFRIEVRCGHAALWSHCACPVQQRCYSSVCS